MTKARHTWEAAQAPREYPWRVAISVPGRGLGDAGDQLDAWCRDHLPDAERYWPIHDARYSREPGVLWSVWGFKLPEPAALFAAAARGLLPTIALDVHDARVSTTPPWGAAPAHDPTASLEAKAIPRRWIVTVERGLSYYRILVPEFRVWCTQLAPGGWDLKSIGLEDRWRFDRRDHAESFQAYLAKRWNRGISRLEESPAPDQGDTV